MVFVEMDIYDKFKASDIFIHCVQAFCMYIRMYVCGNVSIEIVL